MTAPPSRVERILVALVCAVFAGIVARAIAIDAPFEWDEAVYAEQARAWVDSTPASDVEPHRAPLLPLAGTIVARTTSEEWAFRAIGLVSGVALLLAVWRLGRAAAGPVAGVLAAAVIATSPHLMQRSAQFMTDAPAAAALVGTLVIVHGELLGPRPPTRRLLAAPVLGAAAYYLRYASLLPLGLIVVTAAIAWLMRSRPRAALVFRALGLLGLLLVPHAVQATAATGTPWGALTYTVRVGRLAAPFEGLAAYATGFATSLAGWLAGALMGVGILGWLAALVRRRSRARTLGWVISPALAHMVALGIVAHAEPRFMFFSVSLLAVAGAAVVVETARALGRAQVVAAAVVVVIALGVEASTAFERTHAAGRVRAVVRTAGTVIDRDAPDGCGVASLFGPLVTWYTRCRTYDITMLEPGTAHLPSRPGYVLLFDGPRFPLSEDERRAWRERSRPLVPPIAGDPARFGSADVRALR